MLCVYLGTLTSKLCPVDVKISLCLTGLPRVGSRPGEFFSGPLPPRASDITSMTPSTHRGWVSRIQAWLGGTCSTGMALLLVASNSRVLLGQGVHGALGQLPSLQPLPFHPLRRRSTGATCLPTLLDTASGGPANYLGEGGESR